MLRKTLLLKNCNSLLRNLHGSDLNGRLVAKKHFSQQPKEPDVWFKKSSYSWFLPIQTRWKDNDQYQHLNNAVYHTIFEHVMSLHQIRYINLNFYNPEESLGYTMTGNCTFLGSAKYPEIYLVGLGVEKVGNSSLQYRLSMFPPLLEGEDLEFNLVKGYKAGDPIIDRFGDTGLVLGEYTHVWVDPKTKRPMKMNKHWVEEFSKLLRRETKE